MSLETLSGIDAEDVADQCDAIKFLIKPEQHDLGGFHVRRVLPCSKQRMIGPWVFFDHMGPAKFAEGEGINVRPHPHINLATVTYLFDGEMLHKDSLGNDLVIRPGEINLMVAGKGIVHSERQREAIKQSNNNYMNGLQLWLALPEEYEEVDPEFLHYDAHQVPSININDVSVRILIGEAFDQVSPVKTYADTVYIEASLRVGQSLVLPELAEEYGVYVAKGKLSVKASVVNEYEMAVINPMDGVELIAEQASRIVIIGGEKLSRRHMWWNFVSSRKQRIEQAKDDWLNNRFDSVPGDEEEFIPLPDD